MRGIVQALHRYPIKSMRGEALEAGRLDLRGLEGDRAFALVDVETGKIASAKQPRHWAALLALTARAGAVFDRAAVRVTLPDGRMLAADDPALVEALSALLGRGVALVSEPPAGASIERVTPEGEEGAGNTVEIPIAGGAPAGTLVDYAPLHLVTTASLRALEAHHPRRAPSEVARFRPNLVLALDDTEGFVESRWEGRSLHVGEAELRVICATPRCAIPTLAQGELPADREVVRTLGRHNRVPVPGFGALSCLGAYAVVVTPGTVRVGDGVRL